MTSTHVAATTPYAWPFDGDLDGARTALLVVVPAGTETVPAGPEASDAGLLGVVADLARAVREAGGAVVVAGTAGPGGLARRRRTGARAQGAVLPEELVRAVGATEPVHAGGVDAFYGSDLDLRLRSRGIERLLLAGVGLETAVHSTMRDANDRGYECLLIVDACTPVDPALVPAAVSMIEMSGGIFGAVGRSADVVAALSPAALSREGALT